MATMMRVSADTHAALREIADLEHTSMQEALSRAVEAYRRHQLIEATNAAYAALRGNGPAWQEFQEEISDLDGTLLDGLDDAYAEKAPVA